MGSRLGAAPVATTTSRKPTRRTSPPSVSTSISFLATTRARPATNSTLDAASILSMLLVALLLDGAFVLQRCLPYRGRVPCRGRQGAVPSAPVAERRLAHGLGRYAALGQAVPAQDGVCQQHSPSGRVEEEGGWVPRTTGPDDRYVDWLSHDRFPLRRSGCLPRSAWWSCPRRGRTVGPRAAQRSSWPWITAECGSKASDSGFGVGFERVVCEWVTFGP